MRRSDRFDIILLAARTAFSHPVIMNIFLETFDDQEALDEAQAFVQSTTDGDLYDIIQEELGESLDRPES